MGTDITLHNKEVWTSIDQKHLVSDVWVSSQNSPISKGSHTFTDQLWVHHNNVGYIFPQGGSVSISNQIQLGSWESIGMEVGNTSVYIEISLNFSDMFNMWMNHHQNNSSYLYVVVPAVSLVEFKNAIKQIVGHIVIVENSKNVQSVFHQGKVKEINEKGLNLFYIVFYTPSKVTHQSIAISSNLPCAVMVADNRITMDITVSNPSQLDKNNHVVVSINRHLKCQHCSWNGHITQVSFELPSGDNAGQSVTVRCDVQQ